jgi:hypothetical protein
MPMEKTQKVVRTGQMVLMKIVWRSKPNERDERGFLNCWRGWRIWSRSMPYINVSLTSGCEMTQPLSIVGSMVAYRSAFVSYWLAHGEVEHRVS